MSKIIDGVLIICEEPDSKCELCGTVAECRPYGLKGESICFECAEKGPGGLEGLQQRVTKLFDKQLFGKEFDA